MPRAAERYRETYKGVKIDLTAPTKRELTKKVSERKAEIDAGIINSEVTVKVWGDKWLELKKPEVSTPVYKQYKICLNKYIYPTIGVIGLRAVEQSDIKKIINSCSDKSYSLRCKVRLTLSALFRAAIADRIITHNPAQGIKIKKSNTGGHRSLTDEEAALLLKVCETHYAGLWIKTLYYTGIRPQESAPLTWSCIDKQTHELCIKAALKNTGKVGETKTPSGVRRVVLPDQLFNELIEHEGKPDELIFATEQTKNTDHGGLMLTYKAMLRRWDNVLRCMDIAAGRRVERNQLKGESKIAPDLTLYCLRHTYCTNLCRANIPMKTAIELMGHINSDMITEIYADYTADQAEAARKTLTSFFTVS